MGSSNKSDREEQHSHFIEKQIPEEELEFGGTVGAIGLIVFSHWVLYGNQQV